MDADGNEAVSESPQKTGAGGGASKEGQLWHERDTQDR